MLATFASATVESVRAAGGHAIIVIPRSGFSARLVSSYRPAVPVFAVTTDPGTYRQLGAVWGVRPVLAEGVQISYSTLAALGMDHVRESSVAEPGSTVAITAGFPFHESGTTNNLRLDRL